MSCVRLCGSPRGDIVVVLDPSRDYAPEALGQVVQALEACQGRPGDWRSGDGLAIGFTAKLGFGMLGQVVFGSRDIFSGLDGDQAESMVAVVADRSTRGSRLALDLLAGPFETRIDVPVTTRAGDRVLPGRFALTILRQLKRVLDHRFGTFSRLVQFCMVGASGMVVDLTLYALFQLLFARFWPLPSGPSVSGFSWALATARCSRSCRPGLELRAQQPAHVQRRQDGVRSSASSSTYALGNALGIAVSLFLRLYLPLHVGFFARHRLAAAVVGIVVATGISFSMSRWVVFIRRPESRVPPQQAIRLIWRSTRHCDKDRADLASPRRKLGSRGDQGDGRNDRRSHAEVGPVQSVDEGQANHAKRRGNLRPLPELPAKQSQHQGNPEWNRPERGAPAHCG